MMTGCDAVEAAISARLDADLVASAVRMEQRAEALAARARAATEVAAIARALVGTRDAQAKLTLLEATYRMVLDKEPR